MIARELRPFRLPLRTRFRGLDVRRGCLIAGEAGWGEFAPFDDYSAQADARWLACALEQADGRWPAPVRHAVEVNAIIPAVDPDRAAQMARDSGCTTIKIKVGDPGDEARVAAVRQALPDARIRVDGNGAWAVREAVERITRLAQYGLEYVEQPVRDFDDMVRLRGLVGVPLAADELLRVDRRFDDVAQAADVAVLKVAPLGGVAATLSVAERVGLPVVVSSALDTSIGLAAGLAAACALPQPPLACGLGTGTLFAADLTAPLVPVAGRLQFAGVPGLRPGLVWAEQDMDYWRARIGAAQAVR